MKAAKEKSKSSFRLSGARVARGRGQRHLLLFAGLSLMALSLASCAEVARDMGLSNPTDLEQRVGPTGTADQPAALDPFEHYDLVLAADECRYFAMKLPNKWYWKIYLTVANRDETRRGKLDALILPVNPPWGTLPACVVDKTFDLEREGVQAVLGIGNNGPDRPAILKLCQRGAPLHVTIQSEVSSTSSLLGPDAKEPSTGLQKLQGE